MCEYPYLVFLFASTFCFLIALYNYVKPGPKPSRTSYVKVMMKEKRTRKHKWPGVLHQQKTNHIILVQMKDGVIREFGVREDDYCKLEEGMTGLLVWSENRFISFEEF